MIQFIVYKLPARPLSLPMGLKRCHTLCELTFHIYSLKGIGDFPWHRHQMEGTNRLYGRFCQCFQPSGQTNRGPTLAASWFKTKFFELKSSSLATFRCAVPVCRETVVWILSPLPPFCLGSLQSRQPPANSEHLSVLPRGSHDAYIYRCISVQRIFEHFHLSVTCQGSYTES